MITIELSGYSVDNSVTAIANFRSSTCHLHCAPMSQYWEPDYQRDWENSFTSLNQIDHIMTYHDMSSNVTMLN